MIHILTFFCYLWNLLMFFCLNAFGFILFIDGWLLSFLNLWKFCNWYLLLFGPLLCLAYNTYLRSSYIFFIIFSFQYKFNAWFKRFFSHTLRVCVLIKKLNVLSAYFFDASIIFIIEDFKIMLSLMLILTYSWLDVV